MKEGRGFPFARLDGKRDSLCFALHIILLLPDGNLDGKYSISTGFVMVYLISGNKLQ